MKRILSVLLLSAVMPSLFAGVADARKAFVARHSDPFRRSTLVDRDVADDEVRYDKCPGLGSYLFVLPYAKDSRVRFVYADFEGGALRSAKLHVMGFEPKPLDTAGFEKLRDDFPMISVRTDADDYNPVAVLFPARSVRTSSVALDDLVLSFNPTGACLGSLGGVVGRLGVSTAKLAYRVTLKGKDGNTVDLGVATLKSGIGEAAVIESIRKAIEKREPARKGRVSDRDAVDYRHGSEISFAAAK